MQNEKLPKDYDQSIVQKVIEGIKNSIGLASRKSSQELADTTQEIKDSISNLARKIAGLAGEGEGEQGKAATYLPPPENLTVFEFGTWGFAHVDPFFRWKYRGKVVGYEFYGSMNDDGTDDVFAVEEQDYVQVGIHYGYSSILEGQGTIASPNTYLYTKGLTDAESHVLDRRLVKAIASKRLTLENVTQGTNRIIGGTGLSPVLAYGTEPKYKLRAGNLGDPLTWVDGDEWRIKSYPSNLLFSIGALAVFYKRPGNFYAKARSMGKGHSYSNFTSVATSTGVTSAEEIDAPTIVYPVHDCGRTCTLDVADNYKPRCPVHGISEWSEIISGTRETDHYSFFGFEACNVEFVWEENPDTTLDLMYRTKHQPAGEDEEARLG